MKKIMVYQAATQEQFSQNMLASIFGANYVSVEDMEQVVMLRQDGDDNTILEDMFYKMNSEEYRYSLNYSMSTGDVVRIDDTYYRCMPTGWENISYEVHSEEWEMWESNNED